MSTAEATTVAARARALAGPAGVTTRHIEQVAASVPPRRRVPRVANDGDGFIDHCPRCERGVFVNRVCTYCGRTDVEGEFTHALCGRGLDTVEDFNEHVLNNRCPAMVDAPKRPGRPRRHSSAADKQRAYRVRQRRRSVTK